MRMLKYTIDLYRQLYNCKKCMQNDDVKIEILLLENGIDFDGDIDFATVNWVKPNNIIVETEDNIYVNTNVDFISKSEVTTIVIELPRDCTRVAGLNKFEVVLTKKDKQTTTFPVLVEVVGSVFTGNQEVSKNVITSLEDLKLNIGTAIDLNKTFVSNFATTEKLISTLDNKITTGTALDKSLGTKIGTGTTLDTNLGNKITGATNINNTLTSTSATATSKNTTLNNTINTSTESNNILSHTTTLANESNQDLTILIADSNSSKKALDSSKTIADNTTTALETATAKANGLIVTLEHTPFLIKTTDWQGVEPNLTYTIAHNLDTQNLIVQIVNTDTKENMPDNFKFIDNNNIRVRSLTRENLTVLIVNHQTQPDMSGWVDFKTNGGTIMGDLTLSKTKLQGEEERTTVRSSSEEVLMESYYGGVIFSQLGIEPTKANTPLGTKSNPFKDIYIADVDYHSTNGHTKLSNGFIEKWGTVSLNSMSQSKDINGNITRNGTFSFPKAFPTECFSMVGNCNWAGWIVNFTDYKTSPAKFDVTAMKVSLGSSIPDGSIHINFRAVGN